MNRFLPCPRCGKNIAQNPSHADTCLGLKRRVDRYIPEPYHPEPQDIDEIDEIDESEDDQEMSEMSIGMGFKCDDGIVLAADTQHSGALKLRGEKVFEITGTPGISVCIAGAGRVSLIRKAVELIGKDVAKDGATIDMMVKVENVLTTIHQRHIYPYKGVEESRPSLQLLIGVWTKDAGFYLLETEHTVPNFVDDYAVIGSGGSIAEYIIKTSRGYINSTSDAKYLAAYAVAMAKTYDLFCGGETRIRTLAQGGNVGTASYEEVRDWELFFGDLLEANRMTISGLNIEAFEDADIELLVGDYKTSLLKFREKVRQRKKK
ncbi:MAG TPA: hypothetical protein VFZ27_03570 [Terriglobia bacterium]|nr:hypothetical protein [Terriglobia bacterium]